MLAPSPVISNRLFDCIQLINFVLLLILIVPICGGVLSCGQSGSFNSGEVQAVAQEFHKDYGFGGSCEKFRKGIAECNGDDLFRRGQSWPNGTNPGAEGLPNQIRLDRREDLKQALGNEAELDVAMIGGDLSADGLAVVIGLAVQVLVAAH